MYLGNVGTSATGTGQRPNACHAMRPATAIPRRVKAHCAIKCDDEVASIAVCAAAADVSASNASADSDAYFMASLRSVTSDFLSMTTSLVVATGLPDRARPGLAQARTADR